LEYNINDAYYQPMLPYSFVNSNIFIYCSLKNIKKKKKNFKSDSITLNFILAFLFFFWNFKTFFFFFERPLSLKIAIILYGYKDIFIFII